MTLRIKIEDGASRKLQHAIRMLTGPERAGLHRKMGRGVQELTRDHIAGLQRKGGSLASKFNAPKSNFYGLAAAGVAQDSALSADGSGATLVISSIGFKRAFQDVQIVPKTAKSLAIPIHAIAFGHRAVELWDQMSLFIPKGTNVIAATIGGVLTPLYALCKSVTQKQDRALLPSDEAFLRTARANAREYLFDERIAT